MRLSLIQKKNNDLLNNNSLNLFDKKNNIIQIRN